MNTFSQNRILTVAFVISAALHLVALIWHFGSTLASAPKPMSPALEVILVNTKHDTEPLHADALAQANLDGGGLADSGRSKSPLPNMHKVENGDSTKTTTRQVQEETESSPQRMMAQTNLKTTIFAAPNTDKEKTLDMQPQPDGTDKSETHAAINRLEAEISKTLEDRNKRPRKTFISPSTRGVNYAVYYSQLSDKIQKFGTLNFPRKDGKPLYGQLIISIPVFYDGTIYEKEGGVRIESSSKQPALDSAALQIVRRAAPFARFPDNMRSKDRDDLWIVLYRMTFTAANGLETEVLGSDQ